MSLSLSVARAQACGRGPVPGDEHPVPVLVLLPEGQLQQEDVRGVQAVFTGRRQRKQQVGGGVEGGGAASRVASPASDGGSGLLED